MSWTLGGDDEDQVALKLQSQLIVTLPVAHDEVEVHLVQSSDTQKFGGTVVPVESDSNPTEKIDPEIRVRLSMYKTREHLKLVSLLRTVGSGPSMDGFGVLNRIRTFAKFATPSAPEEVSTLTERYRLLSGLPIELASVPSLQRLCLDNNKITVLPPEMAQLTHQIRLRTARAQRSTADGVATLLSLSRMVGNFGTRFVPLLLAEFTALSGVIRTAEELKTYHEACWTTDWAMTGRGLGIWYCRGKVGEG
ncbi:hypothetical protein R1sor_008226 [Riccia sorocarpa]|uniref:Uncharacterized protein n=1 Tax=Riccia sorocarpa TaxID=122646 RepID=A0ABD3HSR0_9MARC